MFCFNFLKKRGRLDEIPEPSVEDSEPSVEDSKQDYKNTENADKRRDMRMMTACMREIQAPVMDLCGLESIIHEIPEDSSIYYHTKVINKCGLLLNDMIQSLKLYYLLASDLYEEENTLFCLDKEFQNIWDRVVQEYDTNDNANMKKNDVKLSLNISNNVPVGLVQCDKTCVLKIFKSLLQNAVHFTLDGEVDVNIYAEKENPTPNHITMELHIDVADTGVGIPLNAQESIFEPLVKAHVDSFEGGVGMGLAVSREMCRFLGGNLILEYSTLSQGSRFHASFPIIVPKSQHTNLKVSDIHRQTVLKPILTAQANTSSDVACRVLHAEDVAINRTIMARILKDFKNITIDFAENGIQALEKCKTMKFDVILMDITMPVMGGFEATAKIKSSCPLNKNTPIIALTGTRAGKLESECFKAGMVDCLAKPVQRKRLINVIYSQIAAIS